MPAHPPRARSTTKLHSRRLERRSRLSCPPDVAARPSLTPATFALAQAYDDDPGTNRRQVVLDVVSPAALARVGQEPARARGVPTPHRARCPRQPAARARTLARREHRPPPCALPARWRRRSPHSCRAACVPQVSGRGLAIETARRDSSRGARLRPTVRCCQGHRRRAPRLFVGRSHAHPVGTILAYVVCWACLYSAQRAKSMPCVSCSECVRVQYPLAASRCSCSLSRRKVASREGSNYACILFTIVRMHASTLSSIAYACIPLKSSITRYRTTHFFVGIRIQAQGCV
mgnify:CR=1 FL=1